MTRMLATRAAYGDALVALGAENPDIVVMDAVLPPNTLNGSSMPVLPKPI
jgi:transketolase C-terminal domain/subunit